MKKEKSENIIVFCAHSDDQILGPGGTLAKYAKEGKNVYTVIFSYGEASLPWFKRKVAIETRVNEAREADRIIGGKGVYFLGLKEGKFKSEIKEKKVLKNLRRIIAEKKPEKIFTHSPEDHHPDHKEVFNAVTEALKKSRAGTEVYCFDIWNPFNFKKSSLPKLYVDITETMPIKMKALKCFASQKIAVFTVLCNVMVKSFIHGAHRHCKYAERFYKVR